MTRPQLHRSFTFHISLITLWFYYLYQLCSFTWLKVFVFTGHLNFKSTRKTEATPLKYSLMYIANKIFINQIFLSHLFLKEENTSFLLIVCFGYPRWIPGSNGQNSNPISASWTAHILLWNRDNNDVCPACFWGLTEESVRKACESTLCIAKLCRSIVAMRSFFSFKVYSDLVFLLINSRRSFGYLHQRPSLHPEENICLQLLNWREYNPVSVGCFLGN